MTYLLSSVLVDQCKLESMNREDDSMNVIANLVTLIMV